MIEGASEKRGDDNGDALKSPSAHAHSLALPINPLPTAELLATTDVVSSNTLGPVKPVNRLHPNSNDDRVRVFDEQGNEYQDPDLERRKREILETMDLDDFTQKSAMSLTQENTPSAYDQFNIQEAIRDDYPSTATPDDGDVYEPRTQNHASLHSKQYASARTESTAYTYEENDSKYIQVDFEPSSVVAGADDEDDVDGEASQDPPLPVPRFEQPQSYEPQTPAPPLNPFLRKGSVMKASQMFGATQPSSIGRRVSPTSSRPSPDVYNDFSSPPKRSRLHSSPLGPRKDVNDDTSPLQSSVRHILAASNFQSTDSPSATIQRTSGVRSFDAGPRIQRSGLVHEPRPYLSMKESQERRKVSQSDTDSDSDSSIDARPLKRLERDRRIRQELSNVGRMPTSSRPSSASAAEATLQVSVRVGRRMVLHSVKPQAEPQVTSKSREDPAAQALRQPLKYPQQVDDEAFKKNTSYSVKEEMQGIHKRNISAIHRKMILLPTPNLSLIKNKRSQKHALPQTNHPPRML